SAASAPVDGDVLQPHVRPRSRRAGSCAAGIAHRGCAPHRPDQADRSDEDDGVSRRLSIRGSLRDAEGTGAFALVYHFRKLARQQGVPMAVVDLILEEARRTGGKTLEEALSEHLIEDVPARRSAATTKPKRHTRKNDEDRNF